jgi:pectate lyase-like protein
MRHSFNNVAVYFAFQVRQFLIFALLVSGAIHVSPVASAAAICTPTGSGTCYYVSPSGSDANSGTSASPFRTIGHAASVVNPGDMVIVEDGLYHEALNLTRGGTPNAYITFHCCPVKSRRESVG